MKQVTIYTDGACSGNPGPGGWGAVLLYGSHRKEISGGEASTTNNRMELTAVIAALSLLKEPCGVDLYSDPGEGLGPGLEKAGLGEKRQKARPEPRSVGAAAGPDRPAPAALPLGKRACGEPLQQPL